ncbi:MAG: hypothetical protein ACREC6_00340 [Hyphomicrobiaceae bacterium]
MAIATPSIAERLKARYGTGYAAFTTLDQVDKIVAERTEDYGLGGQAGCRVNFR